MKRWLQTAIVGMAAVLILVLAGCGKSGNTTTVPVRDGFTCRVAVQYRDMEMQGMLTCQQGGKVCITFEKPVSLSGIAIGWDGKDMSMELGGMCVTVAADKVPQGALLKSLLRVLHADEAAGTVTAEGYVIDGEASGVPYRLVCDPITGLPLSVSVPADEMSATFSEVTLLSEMT